MVAEIIEVLNGRAGDEVRRSELERQGLMINVRSDASFQITVRAVPSVLGKLMIEKGRIPTSTEVRRAARQLDTDLKKMGVKGDVGSGSGYSYPQLQGAAGDRMHRLIAERTKVEAFEYARANGSFKAIRLSNKQNRAARDHLVSYLEERLQGMPSLNEIQEQRRAALQSDIDSLRSGSISVARAEELTRTAEPDLWREDPDRDEKLVSVEAIRIGIGLPSSYDGLIADRKKTADSMRSILDRVGKGESVYGDELEWSARTVHDDRVARAAFGYCGPADQIGADYHHSAIIELRDGTVAQVSVKRSNSDLENSVDEVVQQGAWEAVRAKAAEDLCTRAEKKLRSWARAA